MRRISDYADAQDVLFARKLAELGAATHVIDAVTGFGLKWIQRIVRHADAGGYGFRARKDPGSWLDEQVERLLHGWYMVKAYEAHVRVAHPAERLLRSYATYRDVAGTPVLGVNDVFDVVQLHQRGMAWTKTCTECRAGYLLVSDRNQCPVCHRLDSLLCKCCGEPMPEEYTRPRRGRPRLYCGRCEGRRQGARARKARRLRLAG
jgi:hypothetical protein